MKPVEHWSQVYQTKAPDDVSWFQTRPATSLRLIEACGLSKDGGIIDVGGGASQERLAELVSLNPRTIQKIEAGRLNVLLTTVWRLRDALKCSWEVLMKSGGSGRGDG